jgi:hypothetical protein
MTTPGVNPNRKVPKEEQKPCKFCGALMTKKNLSLSKGGLQCSTQGCAGQMVSQ